MLIDIEKLAKDAGMVSLLNMGAASCVHSEGCHGVTQEHLNNFARAVAEECALICQLWNTARGRDLAPEIRAAFMELPDAPAVGPVDDMLEPLIYAALMHNGTPTTVAEFERAARTVAEMLERRADAKDATRYQALRGTLGVNSFTYAPRITDPSNEWLTYTPDGLDKVCDEMAAALAAKKPASQPPVQPIEGCSYRCGSPEACAEFGCAGKAMADNKELP